jgi:hypothetical protein
LRIVDLVQTFAFDLGFPGHIANNNVGYHISGFRNFDSLMLLSLAPTIAGGAPGDQITAYLQESDAPYLSHQNLYDGVDDGHLPLNDVSSGYTEMAIPFTQGAVVDNTPSAMGLWLSRKGTPTRTGATPSVHMKIAIDDGGGDPSPGSIIDSFYIATDDIPADGPVLIVFGSRGGAVFGPGVHYWIIIDGNNYDASDLNHIRVHYNTVAGSSTCKVYDGATWNQIVNNDLWHQIYQLAFTDVPTDEVEGGAFDPYVNGYSYLNRIDSVQMRVVDLKRRKDWLRTKYAITGAGTYYIAVSAAAGFPITTPVVGSDLQGGFIF